MNVLLETKRPWNWKVFLVLTVMIFVATYANLPIVNVITNSQLETPVVRSWQETFVLGLKDFGMTMVYAIIGLLLANRIGLGLPFVEGWIKNKAVPLRKRCVVAIALILAVLFVAVVYSLDYGVFAPRVAIMLQELNIPAPQPVVISPLVGFLASFAAGIREETQTRLFGISLLAFLGGLLFHDAQGRPKIAVFWAANLVFAVIFGAAHLSITAAAGLPITPLIIARAIVLNSVGGLMFGWLFWTIGFESAVLAHFFADLIMYTLIPIARLPGSETGVIVASAVMGLIVLLAILWAVRTLRWERTRAPALQAN